MFTMRFDMRAKDGPSSAGQLYRAAIEMSEWGENNGCLAVTVCEHHGSPDGYISAPLILASAIAARTQNLAVQVGALLLPLHDPVSTAEQIAVLDLASGGRVSYICGLGYREEEYEMFGVDVRTRGRRFDEHLERLIDALTGSTVTPSPTTPIDQLLGIGGGSEAAARRAARFGLAMLAQHAAPGLEQVYKSACEEYGTEPVALLAPEEGAAHSVFVAEDPDHAWHVIGDYLLHDAQMYASWLGDRDAAVRSTVSTAKELREERGNYRILSVDEAIEEVRTNGILFTQPLCGGIPPALAWPSVRLIADQVIPAAAGTSADHT